MWTNRSLAKNCRVKEQINNLNLSDKLKEGLIIILINDQYESSTFDKELSEDIIYQLDEKSPDTETTMSNENCEGTYLCHCTKCQKTINVLTKDINVLIKDQASTRITIIEKMED